MKRILTIFLILVDVLAFASQPLLQGEIDIKDYSEQVANQSYRISGNFYDLSVVGFIGTNIAVSNLVFTEAINGDCDVWQITNIVATGTINVTVDVVYVESESNTVGMVSGYAALCSLSTNSVGFPQRPSSEFCHLSPNLLNQINNYAFTRILNWPTPAEIGAVGTNDETYTTTVAKASMAYPANDPSNYQGQITTHVTNTLIHVSTADRTNWNGKATLADVAAQGYITNTSANLSGWSGVGATQEISWIYYDSPLTVTNLLASGAVLPAANGIYIEIAEQQGQRAWQSTNGYYNVYNNSDRAIAPDIAGNEAYWILAGTVATGFYPHIDGAPGMPSSTGDVTVVYQYYTYTNSHIWKAGAVDKTKWSVSLDGTNLGIIYPGSNVFPNPIYGNGAGLTNVNATNATALGGVASATWQEATNAINTTANAAVKRAGDIMTGPLTNTYKFYGDGGGLTNLTAPDATNALALGNIAAADWSAATNSLNTRVNNAITNPVGANVNGNNFSLTNVNSVLDSRSLPMTVPAGCIQMYGGAAAPSGWLLCNGATVGTNQYPDLFAVIGTTYGGATTNMNLPDFRGVFPKGAGTTTRAAGVDASSTAYTATLGTYYQDKFQGHYHAVVSAGGQPFYENTSTNTDRFPPVGSGCDVSKPFRAAGITTGVNGTPRTGNSSEPQSLGITFIIKY